MPGVCIPIPGATGLPVWLILVLTAGGIGWNLCLGDHILTLPIDSNSSCLTEMELLNHLPSPHPWQLRLCRLLWRASLCIAGEHSTPCRMRSARSCEEQVLGWGSGCSVQQGQSASIVQAAPLLGGLLDCTL